MPMGSSVPQWNADADKQQIKREAWRPTNQPTNRQAEHQKKIEAHIEAKTIEIPWQVRLQIQPHDNANNNYS